jgi:phosphatidylinositol-3,4,5-trisphosphate 3-phosphatase and dual-specificity protein phosphatase PTEN
LGSNLTVLILQRKLPSPGFEVEVVLVEYNGPAPASPSSAPTTPPKHDIERASAIPKETSSGQNTATPEVLNKEVTTYQENKDDVFSDTEDQKTSRKDSSSLNVSQALEKITLRKEGSAVKSTDASPSVEATTGESGRSAASASVPVHTCELDSNSMSEFKAIAADASVFSFGDEEDYESE